MVTILKCNPHEDFKVPKYHNIGCKTRGKPRIRAEVSCVSWPLLKQKQCEPENTSTWTHRNNLPSPMSRLPRFPSGLLYDFKTLEVTPATSREAREATSLGTVADDDQRTLCETIDALKTGEDRFNHPQARRDRQNDTFELPVVPVVWSPLELIIYQHLHHGSNSISVHRKSIESSTSLRRFIH